MHGVYRFWDVIMMWPFLNCDRVVERVKDGLGDSHGIGLVGLGI